MEWYGWFLNLAVARCCWDWGWATCEVGSYDTIENDHQGLLVRSSHDWVTTLAGINPIAAELIIIRDEWYLRVEFPKDVLCIYCAYDYKNRSYEHEWDKMRWTFMRSMMTDAGWIADQWRQTVFLTSINFRNMVTYQPLNSPYCHSRHRLKFCRRHW